MRRAFLLLAVASAQADVAGGSSSNVDLVFEAFDELALDGASCLLAAEGAAADLPLDQDPYTISAWIQPDPSAFPEGGIVGWGTCGTMDSCLGFRMSGFDRLHTSWWSPADMITPALPTSLADGQWHFVATQYDGTTMRTFVDDATSPVAEKLATRPAGQFTDKSTFCVGKTYGDTYFTGGIKQLRIFKAAVSVEALYQLGAPSPPPPAPPPSPPSPTPPPPPSMPPLPPLADALAFEAFDELALDGASCLLAAEGAAADLPLDQDPYTISAWIQPDPSARDGGIVGWGACGSFDSCLGFRMSGFDRLHTSWWSPADMITPALPTSLADGQWHFVATQYDGTTMRTFVDDATSPVAEKVATRPAGQFTDKSTFCVGKTYGDTYFTGGIKQLRIFKAAVSVEALYRLGTPWPSSVPATLDNDLQGGSASLGGGTIAGVTAAGVLLTCSLLVLCVVLARRRKGKLQTLELTSATARAGIEWIGESRHRDGQRRRIDPTAS